jgi:hypothetical protein
LKCCNFAAFVAAVVGNFAVVIDKFEVLAVDYLVFVNGAAVIEYAVVLVGKVVVAVVVLELVDFVAVFETVVAG